MFNLLVTSKAEAWNDQQYTFPIDRVFEFTEPDLTERFSFSSDRFADLMNYPALFLYERFVGASGKIGKITSITLSRTEVTITFEAESTEIDEREIERRAALLKIARPEFTRTHWSVKNTDLLVNLDKQTPVHSAYIDISVEKSLIAQAQLSIISSPAPSLTNDGKIDAGRNDEYDFPAENDDLPSLPVRQRNLIQVLVAGLPKNSPRHLVAALKAYDDELLARGVQPILGLLNDMADIIAADVGSPGAAAEWLEEGMQKAFFRFSENHAIFRSNFPLDIEREKIFADVKLDEDKAVGEALSQPFQKVATAAADANRSGITTDDFLKIVDKLAEFASVISTQPAKSRTDALETGLRASNIDRILPAPPAVSAKKRLFLSGFGFLEKILQLANSGATFAATPMGAQLIETVRNALHSLGRFFK